jgi:transposase InsO family protein
LRPGWHSGERQVVTGEQPYRFVIHDRDRIYSSEFDSALKAMGLEILKTPFRAPQANAFCERLVGTFRRECLDYLIPLNERHLREFSKSGWLITTEAAHTPAWDQGYPSGAAR